MPFVQGLFLAGDNTSVVRGSSNPAQAIDRRSRCGTGDLRSQESHGRQTVPPPGPTTTGPAVFSSIQSRRSSMCISFHSIVIHLAVVIVSLALASSSRADGQIDASTLVAAPHGPPEGFSGVQYMRYEAMFEGVTSNNRRYRVPCQIIAPAEPSDGS